MKRILYIYILLFCTVSCYKDLGNYDYDRLPELNVEGIEQNYGTMQLFIDSLIIEPVISFGEEDESSFDITWYDNLGDTLLPLTHDLDLRLLLNDAGSKNYIFEAVHRELGISKRVKTWVMVASGMERGFYILKETADGNSELDGHIRLEDNEYKYYPDLITEKLGKPLEGKPVDLDYWDWLYNNYAAGEITTERVIRPVSEKDITVFRMSDFAHIGGEPQLFFDDDEKSYEGVKSIDGASVLFYDGGRLRVMPNSKASRFISEFNGDYELAPMICAPKTGQILVYDKLSSSFMATGNSSTTLKKLPDMTSDGRYMPMNNWEADLRFLGRGLGNGPAGMGYALLEKQKDPGALFLLHFSLDLASRNMITNNSSIIQIDTLRRGLNLQNAELYAMHEYSKLLYYTIDNRVFSYNFLTQQENLVVGEGDFSGPDGVPDEITYLRYLMIFYEYGFSMNGLFVGGYKNGIYTLYYYTLSGGKPVGEPLMWTGEGKIKKMVYASPIPEVDPLYIYQ